MAKSFSTENVVHAGMVPGKATQGKGPGGSVTQETAGEGSAAAWGDPEGRFTETQTPSSGILQDCKVVLFLV